MEILQQQHHRIYTSYNLVYMVISYTCNDELTYMGEQRGAQKKKTWKKRTMKKQKAKNTSQKEVTGQQQNVVLFTLSTGSSARRR